jgi:NADH-quinone oxidoreductase subunit N
MGHSLALTLPEIILSVGSIILLMMAAFLGDGISRVATWLAVALFVGAAVVIPGIAAPTGVAFDGLYIADNFAAFSKVLIYIAAAASLVAAKSWFARDGVFRTEYPVLILLSSVGMGMMVSAGDLLTLYVGLELLSLSSYVLASFQRRDMRSAEAGLKYFVLGALASGILLYGSSLLYGFTGSTLFGDISNALGGTACRPASCSA